VVLPQNQILTWTQSVPPAVAGWYAVGYEKPSASTTYPPAIAGVTDCVQEYFTVINVSARIVIVVEGQETVSTLERRNSMRNSYFSL
jgi:hypothetical protein